MQAEVTEEQAAVRRIAAQIAETGRSAARAALTDGDRSAGDESATRQLMDAFSGLAVPASQGGAGGTLVDLALVVQEVGRRILPTPFVAHVVATQAALGAELDVRAPASGIVRWSIGESEGLGVGWGPWKLGTDGRIRGQKLGVPYGAAADGIVVTGVGGDLALGVPHERMMVRTLDGVGAAADVSFDVEPAQLAVGRAEAALLRATPLVAAELVGIGRGAVELGADHARTREQFGQVIGRFQGVAHQLAEALVGVEAAWSLALYASWAVHSGAPDARRAVHAAKSKAGWAAVNAAERCTQVHGGLGITWEADPHLYLRRALRQASWLGASRWHAVQLGERLLTRTAN